MDKPPTLVHFSNDVPSVYDGEETPESIMEWLLRLKSEAVIEVVTEEMIEDYLLEEEEYLAVLFSGDCRYKVRTISQCVRFKNQKSLIM